MAVPIMPPMERHEKKRGRTLEQRNEEGDLLQKGRTPLGRRRPINSQCPRARDGIEPGRKGCSTKSKRHVPREREEGLPEGEGALVRSGEEGGRVSNFLEKRPWRAFGYITTEGGWGGRERSDSKCYQETVRQNKDCLSKLRIYLCQQGAETKE